jgi:hypothetical protein
MFCFVCAAAIACRDTSPAATAGHAPTVERIRVLLTDQDNGPSLQEVSRGAVVALGSDRVAVLDGTTATVTVVDTSGAVVGTFGRKGGGPGEALMPVRLVQLNGGVAMLDYGKQALVTFTRDGVPQKELPMDSVFGPTQQLTGVVQLPNGDWLYSEEIAEPGAWTQRLFVRRAGTSSELSSTATTTTRPVTAPCGITLTAMPPVFAPTLRWSSFDGWIADASTAEYRIALRSTSRDSLHVVELPGLAQRASDARALEQRIGFRINAGAASCDLTRESALKQRGSAPLIPAIDRVVAGPGGELWIQMYADSGAKSVAHVIQKGATRPDTLASDVFPLFFLSRDTFVAAESDEDGLARLVLWRVVR